MVKVRQRFMDSDQELQRTKLEFELAIETAKVDDRSSWVHSSSSHQATTNYEFPGKATTNLLAVDKTVAVAKSACLATKSSIDFVVLAALKEL